MDMPNNDTDLNYEQLGYDTAKLQELKIPNAEDMTAFNEVEDVIAPGSQPNKIISPYTYDSTLAEEKGLAENEQFSEKYFVLQALYRKVFESEVISKYAIDKYDRAIVESEFSFVPASPEYQSYYQKYSTLNSNYIYLRNNIHIERLSIEQLGTLEDYLEVNSSIDIEDVNSLVIDTFSWVIRPYSTDEDILAIYDGGNTIPNTSIVLEVRYGEADYSEGKPYEFLDAKATEMQAEFSTKDLPVVVLRK